MKASTVLLSAHCRSIFLEPQRFHTQIWSFSNDSFGMEDDTYEGVLRSSSERTPSTLTLSGSSSWDHGLRRTMELSILGACPHFRYVDGRGLLYCRSYYVLIMLIRTTLQKSLVPCVLDMNTNTNRDIRRNIDANARINHMTYTKKTVSTRVSA